MKVKNYISNSMHFRDSNHCNPNIVDISGAIFTFKIHFEYTQTQCEEGARGVNNVLVTVVIF